MSAARRKGSGKDFEEHFAALVTVARAEAEARFPDAEEIQVTHYAGDVIVTVWPHEENSARLFRLRTDKIDLGSEDITPPEPETEDEVQIEVETGTPVEA